MFKKIVFSLLFFLSSGLSAMAADSVQSLIDEGNRLWSQNQLEAAEAQFKQAIAMDADASLAYARLAGLYLTSNRSAEAIPLYQQAIMHDPENPKLFMGLSIAYLHQAEYGMAREMAQEALRLDPKLKNAEKMREYIDAKEAALASTAKAEKPADHH